MAIEIVTVDFSDILAELEADKELQEAIREHQKELDRSSRAILTLLNKVHSIPSDQGELVDICSLIGSTMTENYIDYSACYCGAD